MAITLTKPTTLAQDFCGTLVALDGIAYYLTACCQASGKGGADGVICRACYRPVADTFGMGWLVTDADAWVRYLADNVAAAVADGANDDANTREVFARFVVGVRKSAEAAA
jgi:hypothetical protein